MSAHTQSISHTNQIQGGFDMQANWLTAAAAAAAEAFRATKKFTLGFLPSLLLCFLCAACAHPNPPVNEKLKARLDPKQEYSFRQWIASRIEARHGAPDENLIVLSFSGGGVRASTLATGVMNALHEQGLDNMVALISSTSGGSVTAGVYAAQGAGGITRLNDKFLSQPNMEHLVPRWGVDLLLPGSNRATTFANYLDDKLFSNGPETFGDLMSKWPNAPFVIMNSTDMGSGRNFEFTQDTFSYLCSDLRQFRISQAVSASASVPFALNPVHLQNYSSDPRCHDYFTGIDAKDILAEANAVKQKYFAPERLEQARYLYSLQYVDQNDDGPDSQRENIHLLDGGLADNLAARAILRELGGEIDSLKKLGVKRILLIQVNAKTSKVNAYNQSGGIPSMADVFWSLTLNPIDVATDLSAYISRLYLVTLVRAYNKSNPGESNGLAIYPVSVDFSLMDSADDRGHAQKIDTSWSLKSTSGEGNDLKFLKDKGEELMADNPCYQRFLSDIKGNSPATGDTEDSKCTFLSVSDIYPEAPSTINSIASNIPIPPAPPPPMPPAPPVAPPPIFFPPPVSEKVTFAADAFFSFASDELKPEGKAKLDDLISKFSSINLEMIIAVGHTDSVGSAAFNQKLSERRASSVKSYLVLRGVPTNRIYTEGKGSTQPVANNNNSDGRAKNRRVEVEIVGARHP